MRWSWPCGFAGVKLADNVDNGERARRIKRRGTGKSHSNRVKFKSTLIGSLLCQSRPRKERATDDFEHFISETFYSLLRIAKISILDGKYES